MGKFRYATGVILRLPVVAVLTALWLVTIWPIIAGFALFVLLVAPVLYPFVYVGTWLVYAFLGRNNTVLPDYWRGYPEEYLGWFRTGFETLHNWLVEGWT